MALFWSIFFTTFAVEDWAIAGSLVLVAQGKMSLAAAYWACFFGIAVGDILLYFLGRFANISPRLYNSKILSRVRLFLSEPKNRNKLGFAIVISRALPGTRFVTYTGAGIASYPVWRFLVLTPISVGIWVVIAFAGGTALQTYVSDHWFLGLVSVLVILGLLKVWLPLLADPWKRKSLPHFWRRWFIFEFWPAWFAYAPIIPYYIYLSIRHGSIFQPFYANPAIINGGLIGEAKTDILKYFDSSDAAILNMVSVPLGTTLDQIKILLGEKKISYPFIAKPNIGQRGFAVRIIKSENDLTDYINKANFEFLIQEKSQYEKEAGVFYIRNPESSFGEVCSITDKDFPYVIGDGKTKIGDLILKDKRSQIMALMYFGRFPGRLDEIVPSGEKLYLSECGNHSQGAIFLDGQHLRTPALAKRIDELAKKIPHFYFGRFDIRYESHEALMRGENFEIVEINGAGADITHIYDEKTKVSEAYRVMFSQWRMLFETGKAARKKHGSEAQVDIPAFLKECVRVNIRKNPLAVSS